MKKKKKNYEMKTDGNPLGPLIQVYEDFLVGLSNLSNAVSGV